MKTPLSQSKDAKLALDYYASKLAFSASPGELKEYLERGEKVAVYDLRKKEDFVKGHIPGAIHLPESDWYSYKGLSKDGTALLYGYSGDCNLAAKAGYHFAENGFATMELKGGFDAWKGGNYAIEGSYSEAKKYA
ncbi:MAG: rhodanese-like domain-containing protein [Bdellovibrionia bacterium]